ncbi:MAG TPA: hypothetical protein VGC69_14225 [Bordetella sp.]
MPSATAYLNHWPGRGPAALTGGPNAPAEPLALYDLAHADLRRWRSLLVPAHADQRFLAGQRERLEVFLLSGGTLVFNGHVAYPFLRWLRPFQPVAHRGLDGLRVHRAEDHPIFEGVDPEHLTFRRGVAGFYARGGNPPAPGARVLHTLGPDALPVDWLLELPGGGRLLVHSGNDLWMYAGGGDSAARVVPQLLAWLEART